MGMKTKLSARMLRELGKVNAGEQIERGPTRGALLRRGLIEWLDYDAGTVRITDLGRQVLKDQS